MKSRRRHEPGRSEPTRAPKKDAAGVKIAPPPDDARGDALPGFGGEGARSELADGAPLDERTRRRNAEHNRDVSPQEVSDEQREQRAVQHRLERGR